MEEDLVKIAVCIKRVPDTETKIKIRENKTGIDASGVNFVLNPYDEYAVEEAIRLKEKGKATEIAVLCYGPAEASKEIRTALAMGADSGILIKDAAASEKSPDAVAAVLAAALKGIPFDLLLFGKQAIDDDASGVGPMVAARLKIPVVSFINKLDLQDGKVVARRDVEGGTEIFETKLPCAFTAQKGLNEPRLPALKGIMKAKKMPIQELAPAAVANKVEVVQLQLPPPRAGGKVLGEGEAVVPELVRRLRVEAKVL
jgi:electron transfer flavoprotein beta subunit